MSKTPAHRIRRRPGFFHPVPLRSRRDGWSEARQCAFLAHLYVTGSVSAAAARVGMSRASAYRLRKRDGADGFAHAWDRILTPPGQGTCPRTKPDFRKVTDAALVGQLETGLVSPVVFRGRMAGIRRKPDITACLRLFRRQSARDASRFADQLEQ